MDHLERMRVQATQNKLEKCCKRCDKALGKHGEKGVLRNNSLLCCECWIDTEGYLQIFNKYTPLSVDSAKSKLPSVKEKV